MEGYKYIGMINNQISGYKPYTYLVEINGIYGFFEISLNEEEEQALIGARLAFNLDTNKNLINKYRILEYVSMNNDIEIQNWQEGSKSNVSPTQRLQEHQEWLKKQHKDVRDNISSRIKVEEKPVQGFVKD
jgi:hypothetical protein